MIPRSEIRSIAAQSAIAPVVVDHDYALGCFLHFLAQEEVARRHWIFKGGTCLAKCWFPDYRFSEDLDFTAVEAVTHEAMLSTVKSTARRMQERLGIRTDLREPTVETINDEYGRESFEGKVYYQGIWQFRGDPRAIKVHVSRDEAILFAPISKEINHPYSDRDQLGQVDVRVYALEEVVSEKLRAFAGQRRFTVARDVFDLHFLRDRVDLQRALPAFHKKREAKGLGAGTIDLAGIEAKREDYRANWEQNLFYLLPESLRMPFDAAWGSSLELLRQATNRRLSSQ